MATNVVEIPLRTCSSFTSVICVNDALSSEISSGILTKREKNTMAEYLPVAWVATKSSMTSAASWGRLPHPVHCIS